MTATALTREQLANLSRALRERYAALELKATGQDREGADYAAAEVRDQRDAGAEAQEEVRSADLRREREEMADIEQALAAMHAETYGVCVDCGQSIGLERLLAYPTAKRCRGCQEIHERQRGKGAVIH